MKTIFRITFLAAASSLLLSACALDGTKPDDMSAAQHRAAADREKAEAKKHNQQHEPAAIRTDATRRGGGGVEAVYWDIDAYNPTSGHKSEAEAHRGHASAHAAAAKSLENFEEAECKAFPTSTRVSCPLLGPVAAVEDIDGGVRIRLSEGVAVEPVADHVRCHFAFARAQGYAGMDACPLFLKGLRVESADGYIDLLMNDKAQLDELRRRAHAHASETSDEG